ncbi:MAG: hypothetical protein Q9160_007756 [Pyrenula sp. 1 TL-2023]
MAGKSGRIGNILSIPVYLTTQNAARLGLTIPEITDHLPAQSSNPQIVDKTAFSMIPSIDIPRPPEQFPGAANRPRVNIILLGIETHICVLQTTLDLLRSSNASEPINIYLLVDGISSCNAGERTIALRRLENLSSKYADRSGTVTLTTSESIIFELLGDAQHEKFREISKLVKETREGTAAAVASLCDGL